MDYLRTVVGAVVVCASCVLCRAQDSAPPDSFEAWCKKAIPSSGYVDVVYEATQGAGAYRMSFDFASGAFVRTAADFWMRRSPTGEYVFHDNRDGLDRTQSTEPVHAACMNADVLPILWAASLRALPVERRTVTMDGDGTLVVRVTYPPGGPCPPPNATGQPVASEYRLRADGRVDSVRFDFEKGVQISEYKYDPKSPREVGVAATSNGGLFRLRSVSWQAVPPADFLDTRRLEVSSSEIRAEQARQLRILRGEEPQPEPTVVRRRLTGPEPEMPMAQWRLPLIAGGVVFLAIGVYGLWRRKS